MVESRKKMLEKMERVEDPDKSDDAPPIQFYFPEPAGQYTCAGLSFNGKTYVSVLGRLLVCTELVNNSEGTGIGLY
jgi:hypothetical protein